MKFKSIVYLLMFSLLLISCEPKNKQINKNGTETMNSKNEEGLKMYNKGSFEPALKLFEEASKEEPKNAEYPNNMGTCYLHLNKPEEAKKAFLKAISLNPDLPLYHYNLGLAFLQTYEPDKAIGKFKDSVSVDAKYFQSWAQLGAIYYQQRKFDEAESAWLKASSIIKEAEVENNLGMIYMEKGDPSRAEKQFKKAAQIDKNYALAHYNLGVLYQQQKKYKDADAAYANAIRINPTEHLPYYNRAIVLTALNKRNEAIKSLEAFIKYCPPSDVQPIRDAMARIRELKGN
jgi:tetratricopeptide (TPR) repeat protein